jgi:hypothetical protein
MALYQRLSRVTEEKQARPHSREWKFESGTFRIHAFIVTTTRDSSVDDDDDDDDLGELLSMTSSASCRQIRTISFSKRKGNVWGPQFCDAVRNSTGFWNYQLLSSMFLNASCAIVHTIYEDGTGRVFRNVGKQNSDSRVSPTRKNTRR